VQRYPIAYLRRSSADSTDPGDISREAQETAVRELARRDGHNGELRIPADWGRSADDTKEGRRTGYLSMLAAIDRGECDVVYAASLDRLYRSMRTFVRLTDAAKANGTRIVTLPEGVLGGDGADGARLRRDRARILRAGAAHHESPRRVVNGGTPEARGLHRAGRLRLPPDAQ